MVAPNTGRQKMQGLAIADSQALAAPEAISSISSGLSIVGKIVGNGRLAIFGHVQGEIQASTVQLGDGAQIEGNIIADELTIGGRVKGTIRANRVKLLSTAVVEGDIYHRSLAIEENAQFEGMSRRKENVIDMPSLVPAKVPQAQAMSIKVHKQANGAADGVIGSQPCQSITMGRTTARPTRSILELTLTDLNVLRVDHINLDFCVREMQSCYARFIASLVLGYNVVDSRKRSLGEICYAMVSRYSCHSDCFDPEQHRAHDERLCRQRRHPVQRY